MAYLAHIDADKTARTLSDLMSSLFTVQQQATVCDDGSKGNGFAVVQEIKSGHIAAAVLVVGLVSEAAPKPDSPDEAEGYERRHQFMLQHSRGLWTFHPLLNPIRERRRTIPSVSSRGCALLLWKVYADVRNFDNSYFHEGMTASTSRCHTIRTRS